MNFKRILIVQNVSWISWISYSYQLDQCTQRFTHTHTDGPHRLQHPTPAYSHTHTHRHTHTRSFNGSLSRTTRVSQYQKGKINLDFTEARDSEWQWHQLGHVQVCILLQTDNHARDSGCCKIFTQRGHCNYCNYTCFAFAEGFTDTLASAHLFCRYVSYYYSVAEWLACWTQAQKGPGSNHSCDAVG